MNTQAHKKIIQGFTQGDVSGLVEPKMKPKHIQSVISHIFLFSKTAYKIYKSNNHHFNKLFVDLGNKKTRKEFYEEDFLWNNYFNKNVYRQLMGAYSADTIEIKPRDGHEDDLIIQMTRVNAEKNLTFLLQQHLVFNNDLRTIGFKITKAVAEFSHLPAIKKKYYDILAANLNDLKNFSYLASPFISHKNTDGIVQILASYLKRHKHIFTNYPHKDLVVALDDHSDNVFYDKNKNEVTLMDVMPPKENWRIHLPVYNIFRLSVDVLILGNKKLADALIQGYKNYYKGIKIDKKLSLFFQLYSALIRAATLFMLVKQGEQRKNEACQYQHFIKSNLNKLLA